MKIIKKEFRIASGHNQFSGTPIDVKKIHMDTWDVLERGFSE